MGEPSANDHDSPREQADRLFDAGVDHLDGSDHGAAEACFATARAGYASLELERDVADCDQLLGQIWLARGRYDDAIGSQGRARETYQRLRLDREAAGCSVVLALACVAVGRYADAFAHQTRARAVLTYLRADRELADCEYSLGLTYAAVGRHVDAITQMERARDTYQRLESDRGVALCDLMSGHAHAALNQFTDAIADLERAGDAFRELELEREAAGCDLILGGVAATRGLPTRADASYRSARRSFAALGLDREVADCDLGLGTVHALRGRFDDACALYGIAREAYLRLDLLVEVAHAEWALGLVAHARDPDDIEETLAWWVPGLLYLDSLRFQFAGPSDRQQWASTIRPRYAAVYELAARAGDASLIADLVLSAVNSGIYAGHSADTRSPGPVDDPISALAVTTMVTALAGTDNHTPPIATTLSGTVAAVAGSDLPLSPAPPAVAAYHRTTLATFRALAMSRYRHDPGTGGLRTW